MRNSRSVPMSHCRKIHAPITLISCPQSSSPSPSAPSSRSSAPRSGKLARSCPAHSCCTSIRHMLWRRSSSTWRLWRIRGVGGLGPVGRKILLSILSSGFQCVCVEEEHTPGSLMPQSPHLGAVPRFLMWRYRSLPPGVLVMRTLLERVL